MDRGPAEDRSALSLAWAWATRVIVLAATMVAPGMIGYWIDQRLGTRFVFMLIGFVFGITVAVMQLVRIAGAESSSAESPQRKSLPPDRKPPPS